MKLAIIGSRDMNIENIGDYIPEGVSEIVSGGARGIDTCAREYAQANGIKLTEFLPDYERYKRIAPLMRNISIIEYADELLAFWDGKSRGTKHILSECKKRGKKVTVIEIK